MCRSRQLAAAGAGHRARPNARGLACDSGAQQRYSPTQGNPGGRTVVLTRRHVGLAAAACLLPWREGHAAEVEVAADHRLEPLAPDLWWVRAFDGDADRHNRGLVSHLLVMRDGERVWLLGSGPSPAMGARLARRVAEVTGRGVTDVVSPWARPELVLGQRAFAQARHWAHADVARAMADHCASCVARLRVRLGDAQADLGDDPILVPERRLRGREGDLGPWHWWRLRRADGVAVTLWASQRHRLITAHGLVWTGGAPDLRDADLVSMQTSTAALLALLRRRPPGWRVLGEQGPLGTVADVEAQDRYWRALRSAVQGAIARGDPETQVPDLPGIAEPVQRDPRHAMNWQRAWRQFEARELALPAARR